MAAGLIREISYGADIEVFRHGGTQFVEQATQVFYGGAPILRDANGLVGECAASFTHLDALSLRAGQNGSASGLITMGLVVAPGDIFEATLLQGWNQNLALPGIFYTLTRTAIPGKFLPDGVTQAYAWCVDTAGTAPHVEIIGQPGPADNALAGGWATGDTYARVLIRFNPALSSTASSGLADVANSITAFSGGGQTSATALTASFNRVTTVAALGDSVRLPTSVAGRRVVIDNQGAFPLRAFGASTDTVNGIATATGISQGVGVITSYFCTVAGNWEATVIGGQKAARVALTTNGAIDPHTSEDYVITKAGVLADTLAAPTTTTDDGVRISLTSNTTNAHTLTATGLLGTGSANVNLATFAAFLGAGLELEAYQGKWLVRSQIGITFS